MSPDKVVEVLQAVHLLLSFPAFVVVVAVDARWVSQSLRIGYKDLFGQDDSADIDGDGIPDSFRATPHDYLEKIFQIPFWLYPMNIEGRRNLLTQLMESNLESEPAKESNPLNDVNSNKIVVSERIMANSEAVNINANSDISKNISGLERKDSLNPALQNERQTESKDASSNLTESDSSEEFPFKLEESAADAEQLTIKREESDFSLTLAPILGSLHVH